jgi:hypothetical protein
MITAATDAGCKASSACAHGETLGLVVIAVVIALVLVAAFAGRRKT